VTGLFLRGIIINVKKLSDIFLLEYGTAEKNDMPL
jgi:hypothetical protein